MSIKAVNKKCKKRSAVSSIILTGLVASLANTLVVDNKGIHLDVRSAQAANGIGANQQSHYQTYVIHTYGGSALIPAVKQQLDSVVGGGSVSAYQDKLVVRTTTDGYNQVQRLLAQIDKVPQSIQISVKVGSEDSSANTTQQGQVVITNNGKRISRDSLSVGAYGRYDNQTSRSQSNSLYTVNTLSGSPARIGTSTLLSLLQSQTRTLRNRYGQPVGYVIINGVTLASTAQGIAVTPTLLPNNQVQVSVNQSEDKVTGNTLTPINSQQLATTLIVPRGKWVTIGEVSRSESVNHTGYGRRRSTDSTLYYPIQIKVE